jgi:NAD dependent epimerase/dehydratase family enzyme
LVAGKEMADEMLIGGARVRPTVLQEHGFHWEHPMIEPALRSVL